MNELIPKEPTMSSLQIKELLTSGWDKTIRHDNVKRTMDRLRKREVIQLTPSEEVNHLGQKVEVYHVNERDSYVVVAQLSPEFTAQLVDEWKKLKETSAFQVPKSMSEALLLAGQLAADNEKLEAQAAIDAPKVSFVEEVVEQGDGLMTLSNYGRVLKKQGLPTGAKKIFNQLRMLDIIMAGKPLPYDRHINAGRFIISEKITAFRADPVTFVTGKGQIFVHDKLSQLFER